MRAFALICLWLLLSGFTPGQQIVALNPQVRPDNASAGLPAVDDNWAVAGYPYAGGTCAEWGHRVPCYLHQSTTRASTAYCTALDGLLFNVATGVLRQCAWNGALIEEARTNIALWSRDYTNAVWVKVNVTAVLTATGADNVANSASLLTATAANGTILQTITIASAQRALSVYVQRVTGSGAINISQDGIAWTALTSANCALPGSGVASALITTGYVKCTLVATQLNPVIGFQIATNGDAVNADFTGLEAGAFSTSAIPTTTVSVTRAADNVTPANAFLSFLSISEKSAFGQTRNVLNATLAAWYILNLNSTGVFTDAPLRSGPTPNTNVAIRAGSSTPVTATLGSGTLDASTVKSASSWGASGVSVVANNGTLVTAANIMVPTTSSKIGSYDGSSSFLDGFLQRLIIYNSRIPDAALKAMTQ